MKQTTFNNVTWVDILGLSEKQANELKQELGLASSVHRELLTKQNRSKIEEYDNYIFIVLHFPVHNKETRATKPVELDFIVTPSRVITFQQQAIPALETFFETCDDHDDMKITYFRSAGYLLFSLLDKLIDSSMPMLDHLHEKIDKIEDQIFKGIEKDMLYEIAIVKNDVIDFRRAVKPQKSIYEILTKKAGRFFGHEVDHLTPEITGSNIRVWNTLENLKELIESLEETNNSLLSYKLSHIMKTLTIVSFITFPLSLIVAIFSMDVRLPFLRSPYNWFGNVAFIVLAVAGLTSYFRKKKWF